MTRERGFTLVSAVFLTVVLVALGASLVSISAVQQTTSAQQLQAVRANYAARAGLEWAIGKATAPGVCAGTTTLPAGTLGGQLASFAVTVQCTQTSHDIDGTATSFYTVDVTVESGNYGSPDFVLRRVQAKVGG